MGQYLERDVGSRVDYFGAWEDVKRVCILMERPGRNGKVDAAGEIL